MAKLRHIAVHTPDPEKTAEFYKRVFDMVEVGRTDSPIAKGIYLSDGTINIGCCDLKPSKLQTARTDWDRCLACTTLGFGSTTSRKPGVAWTSRARSTASAGLRRRRRVSSKRNTRDPTL